MDGRRGSPLFYSTRDVLIEIGHDTIVGIID